MDRPEWTIRSAQRICQTIEVTDDAEVVTFETGIQITEGAGSIRVVP